MEQRRSIDVAGAKHVNPIPSAALSGLFLGVTWLSGHHQVPIFLTLAVVGAWGWYTLRSGRPASPRP